jgi:hypothetical protein
VIERARGSWGKPDHDALTRKQIGHHHQTPESHAGRAVQAIARFENFSAQQGGGDEMVIGVLRVSRRCVDDVSG